MNDMRSVIIPKSDQINADNLLGGALTIKINRVEIRPGTEQPVSIYYDGDNNKPYKPCKSMARVMVTMWGADANEYIGRSMTLYCDPKVLWGGMAVGGIRISHMSDISEARTMALTATKGNKKPFTVKPLIVEVQPTQPDKAADGVRALIERIQGADEAALRDLTSDPSIVTQRAWLAEKRPELAARVDAAIVVAVAAFEPDGDLGTQTETPE
jgi:hypothetical protein